jgi:sugar phosphate isomerase/epimerase
MKKIPIALQLWSVREEMNRDFAGTVATVAKIGYAGVELAGYGNLDARGAKRALDAAGLAVAGMHVGRDLLGRNIEQVIEEAQLLGARHVTCPWWPPAEYTTAKVCQGIGQQLDAIGAILSNHGLQFSFHNHAAEAKMCGDRMVLEWILGAAKPGHLAAEPDVYWIHAAGGDPARFLREHGARCPLIHLKDETELGRGPVAFEEVFAAIDDAGAAEWLIVEQEKYHHAPLQSVRLCYEQLQAWHRA